MAAAATLPTKTIFITMPASVSNSTNYVPYQSGVYAPKIGTKRSFSIVSSPAPVSFTLSSQSSLLAKSPSPPSLTMGGGNLLPATVQRTFKYETVDDDYEYGDDSEESQYADGESDQPPRKRERLTHLTAEEKMFRRKMKNRIAAQTARDRKKALMGELEETVRRLEEENDTLVVENSKLRHEQSSLADENERLKKMLAEQQKQQQQGSTKCSGQDDARVVSAFGPAEGASEGRMGVDLVTSIRADPAVLEILRQIVTVGGAGKNASAIGAIEGERKFDIGGCAKPQSAGGHREIMGDDSIVQGVQIEAAVNDVAAFVESSSANSDHEYFNSAFTSPASPSSSVLFSSSSNESFDLESLLQPAVTDLFSTNDTADIQQYFNNSTSPIGVNVVDSASSSAAINGSVSSAKSPNSVVPTSPTLNFDPDFPQLGDDILEQALKSLGDLTKMAENTAASSSVSDQQGISSGFDFLQNDDYTDLAWEESFAQLFPSLSNA